VVSALATVRSLLPRRVTSPPIRRNRQLNLPRILAPRHSRNQKIPASTSARPGPSSRSSENWPGAVFCLAPIVTANELFAGCVSMPLNNAAGRDCVTRCADIHRYRHYHGLASREGLSRTTERFAPRQGACSLSTGDGGERHVGAGRAAGELNARSVLVAGCILDLPRNRIGRRSCRSTVLRGADHLQVGADHGIDAGGYAAGIVARYRIGEGRT